MSSKISCRIIPSCVMSAILLLSPIVEAQTISPEKIERGQKLYDEAIALMEQSNYTDACPKLEEVLRLVPDGVGAKLELGRCYEGDSRFASAWKAFKIAEAAAAQAGQAERHKKARDRATELEGKLSTLTIIVPETVRSLAGFGLTRNGSTVDPMDWGTGIPVDGGTYRLEAVATNKIKWNVTVEIGPSGDRKQVEIGLLADATPPKEDRAVNIVPPPVRPWQKPLGLGLTGLGIASVAVGSVLGGLAIARHDESNAGNHCDATNHCDDVGLDLRRDSLGFANASTGLFIAGGAFLVGGIVLFATAPKMSSEGAAQPKTSVSMEWTAGGFRLRGRF